MRGDKRSFKLSRQSVPPYFRCEPNDFDAVGQFLVQALGCLRGDLFNGLIVPVDVPSNGSVSYEVRPWRSYPSASRFPLQSLFLQYCTNDGHSRMLASIDEVKLHQLVR